MRQTMMQRVWIDGHRVERADRSAQAETPGKMLWRYGWGLLFVILMTLLSVFGPRTVYSKQPPAQTAASQPVVPGVK